MNNSLCWKLATLGALLLCFIPSLGIVSLALSILTNFRVHLTQIIQDRVVLNK